MIILHEPQHNSSNICTYFIDLINIYLIFNILSRTLSFISSWFDLLKQTEGLFTDFKVQNGFNNICKSLACYNFFLHMFQSITFSFHPVMFPLFISSPTPTFFLHLSPSQHLLLFPSVMLTANFCGSHSVALLL